MKKESDSNMPIHSFNKLQNIGLTSEDFANEIKKTTGKIFIEDLKIYAYHGVLSEERQIGTDYLINAEIHTNLWDAARTDDLKDTINYAEINEIIHQEMATPSQLLENVVGRILNKLGQKFIQISYAKIKLTKTNPPMHGEMKGVSVEMDCVF